VSASAYYRRARGERCARDMEDERLLAVIRETHRRTTRPTDTGGPGRRAGETAPRCQVQRLVRAHGIEGANRRGKPWRAIQPRSAARDARGHPTRRVRTALRPRTRARQPDSGQRINRVDLAEGRRSAHNASTRGRRRRSRAPTVNAVRERPRRPDATRSGRATGRPGMKVLPVASPTGSLGAPAEIRRRNLQTQSPRRPVRLKALNTARQDPA
jgi:hypothetical protein